MDNINIISQNNSKWIIEQRRYLHKHPELSLCESNTAKYCSDIMKGLGYSINQSWGNGFTADIEIPGVIKRIAFRTDMDALPIQEKSGDSFTSINQNISHACGHDTHMAIALGTAKIIAENSKRLEKNIRFIFQPSEERLPGGAKGMIESGCLDDVDEIYGLHNDPGTEIGEIRI